MKFICTVIFILSTTIFTISATPVSDVTRRIHGSYGAFRDFTLQDCTKSHENSYERCAPDEVNDAFVFHWNDKLQGCERKLYRGCGATRNNFLTEKACETQAKPICSGSK